MPSSGRKSVRDFRGTAKDVHRARLDQGYFQDDEGGDRFERGTWKVRRGMRHTSVPRLDSAITSIIGFELPGGDFGLVVVEGVNGHAFVNVTEQPDTTGAGGFGVGGFGVGGFGT